MNIICIDFSNTSDKDLKVICKKYQLIYDELVQKKTKFGLDKMFIDLDAHKLFAYTLTSDKNKVEFTNAVSEILNSIPACKVDIVSDIVKLDIDSILDKISKYGIESLVKEEKEFLDQASKS